MGQAPERKVRILVTSIGSLVGQNLVDVLEYPALRRRDRVELIGTNSLAASPNNFRCDRCYLVPNTESDEFKRVMVEIIGKEAPDLILSGRDEDSEVMALLMHDHPELSGKLPYGSPHTLTFALDKWVTWEFTRKHGLPFAETFVLGKSGGKEELRAFIEENGYPLIAKPIQGFASKGVFFVSSWEDAEHIAGFEGYMFQEYLGNPDAMNAYFAKFRGPVPLFAHAPDIFHHSCHTVISPDGTIDPVFISRNEHDSGVTVGFRKVEHPTLEKLTMDYARAVYAEGGWGPITVQFRNDRHGGWKAQEMNMRTNGNTFPRFMMGQDDLGLIMKGVLPELDFPVYHAPLENKDFIIGKSWASNIMLPDAISTLRDNRFWSE